MQKRIKKLAQGVFDYEALDIMFQTKKIELEIQKSKKYTNEFVIEARNDVILEGRVFTSHERMQCVNTFFEDHTIRVLYQFDSEGMEEGDTLKGEFYLILKDGEYRLPFVVTIKKVILEIKEHRISSLDGFLETARTDMNLAFRFFQMEDFIHLIEDHSKAFLLYKTLSVTPLQMQKMEEFLVNLNLKHRIEFSIEKTYYTFENVFEPIEDTILIRKNHWGYFVLHCSSDSDSLKLCKKYLTPEDFIGSTTLLPFKINPLNLHAGKNFVKVILSNAYQVLEIEICISNHTDRQKPLEYKKKERQLRISLEEEYINYRLQKKTSALWARDSIIILNQLIEKDTKEHTWYLLIKAWILVINKQRQEAEWILDDLKHYVFRDKTSAEYGFYLYIQTFLIQEMTYMQKATEQIEQIYTKTDHLLLFLTLLFLKEEYVKNDFVKYKMIKAYIRGGLSSALLYAEMLALLRQNPYLLERMDVIERRVLCWGAKKQAINKELAIQSLILIQSIKGFHKQIYIYLCDIYEVYPQELTVQTICKMLIKGHCYAPQYLKWYTLGLEQNLNLIGLNDAYLMSLDKRSIADVPREIELFYQMDGMIPDEQKAVFFVNMIAKKQKDPELFLKYKPMMEQFCQEQIKQERMDDNLSIIYTQLLTAEMINAEMLLHLAKLLFIHKITVFTKDAIRIAVASVQTNQVVVEGIVDCSVYLSLYSKDSVFSIEDKNGLWYSNLNVQVQPMLSADKFVRKCIELGGAQAEFWFIDKYVFFASEILKHDLTGMHNRILLFLKNTKISETYKQKLYKDFLNFYERHRVELQQERKLFLQEIYQNVQSKENKAKVFCGLMEENMLQEAYTFRRHYRWMEVTNEQKLQIYKQKVSTATSEEKKALVFESMDLLKAKQTSKELLETLVEYYQGPLKDLCLIWQDLKQYGIQNDQFEEKILQQYLYTAEFDPCIFAIFNSYQTHAKDEALMEAFLNYVSELYFIKDIQVDEVIFENIKKRLEQENTLADVCGLAFLKYASMNFLMQKKADRIIEVLLEDFMKRDMIFAFYKNFNKNFLIKFNLYDRTIIEYKTNKKTAVSIHFRKGQNQTYCTQQMQKVYKDIYIWQTILFFGDSIDYYIEENNGTIKQITESKTIENNNILNEDINGKFDLINVMLSERMLENDEILDRYVTLFQEYETLNEDEFLIL